MKNHSLVLTLLIVLSAAVADAVEINFTSPAFENAVTSTGDSLTPDFNFTLCSFDGFVPDASNYAQWQQNFTALKSATWDLTFSQFSQTVTLLDNASPFTTSDQAYILGLNNTSLATSTEVVLLTNPSWHFPPSGNITPISWDISDSGTLAVLGYHSDSLGAQIYLQTAAVPEPATTGLVVSILAGVGVGIRRRYGRRSRVA